LSSFFNKSKNSLAKPGCDGKGCHTKGRGFVEISHLDNLQILVKVKGLSRGSKIGGELLDINDKIVDFVDETEENPFILAAPDYGRYKVHVAFDKPARKWVTQDIQIRPTAINIPTPSPVRTDLTLHNNHPDPFNKETMIRFSLPKSTRIELLVFTENGKLVSELASGIFPTGIHSVRWNGRDQDGQPVPAGIYLCEMKSEQQRQVKGMILVR
jgi:hypothetical protein